MNVAHHSSNDLQVQIKPYLNEALSANTRKAYRNDMKHFMAWGGCIPSNPEHIAHYLASHAQSLSIATLQRRIVSIGKAHRIKGYPDPTKTDEIKMLMRGIRRKHGKPQRRVEPIMKDDLILMLSHISTSTPKGMRDRALLMLGFCGAFRRSEIVALHVHSIDINRHGLVVHLNRSKTDQTGEGREIAIPYGKGKHCPVKYVHNWMIALKTIGRNDDAALFPSITKGGTISHKALSCRSVANIIKAYTEKSGLDSTNYSGHSLRAGLATSAAQQGFSSWSIRKQTGHASDAMLERYIRHGSLFTDNAAALF